MLGFEECPGVVSLKAIDLTGALTSTAPMATRGLEKSSADAEPGFEADALPEGIFSGHVPHPHNCGRVVLQAQLHRHPQHSQQDALLHVPHTDASSIATASHNDALSTTLVLSPSVEANEPSDNSRATYCLDPSRKIYAVRAKIIRQIWENETFIRTSVVRENGKQHMAKTVMALQGLQ
ncbi:hypothetical protein MRX96_007631 [Rhipicephalus microplus]